MDDASNVHDDWQFAWQILHALVTLAIAIYAYAADRHRAHRSQLEELREKFGAQLDEQRDKNESRLAALEQGLSGAQTRMEALPSAAAVSQLNVSLAGLSAQMEGVRDSMKSMSLRLERWEDYVTSVASASANRRPTL